MQIDGKSLQSGRLVMNALARVDERTNDLWIQQLMRGMPRLSQLAKARRIARLRKPANDLGRLLKRDYVRCLRRSIAYPQVKEIVETFQRILPRYNSKAVRIMSTASFHGVAERLGFKVMAQPFGGSEGLALRGFYATHGGGMLKHPLIFVNTAHHPIVITTSFLHELGHHASHQILNLGPAREHFYFGGGYVDQLMEPSELAADIVVSFAGYPEKVARKIFSDSWDWGLVARAAKLPEAAFSAVQNHLKRAYGFDLYVEQVPAEQRLQYLSGIVHYAKLRWALLAEYDL